MPRALLILFLMGAQLVSWNASPLFLCLDSDGAVCVDLGPASCACCRHHHDAEHRVERRGRPPDERSQRARLASMPRPAIARTCRSPSPGRQSPSRRKGTARSTCRPWRHSLADGARSEIASAVASGRLLIGPACEFSSGIAGRSAVLRC